MALATKLLLLNLLEHILHHCICIKHSINTRGKVIPLLPPRHTQGSHIKRLTSRLTMVQKNALTNKLIILSPFI
jgi:hypothetical protein